MKDTDRLALNSFNPDKNLYLYLDVKDPSSPLKVRNCKILSVPLLGRILRWLGYTTKPFEKVISYLLSEGGGLKEVKENDQAIKEKIKVKIDHFFFDKNTQKLKHQKLWEKVKAQYEQCFGKSQPLSGSRKKEEEEFNQGTDWTVAKGLKVRDAKIPDSLQQLLPKANYFVLFSGGQRFEPRQEEIDEFIRRKKRENNYPCVIIVSRQGAQATPITIPPISVDGKDYPSFQLNYDGIPPNTSFFDNEFNRSRVLAIKAAIQEEYRT